MTPEAWKPLAALPPESDAPPLAEAASPPRKSPPKAAAPKAARPPRIAALPPPNVMTGRTMTDAPITVLRGGPVRTSQSGRSEPVSATPTIKVIRGARARPSRLEGIVQPGPLILHIQD